MAPPKFNVTRANEMFEKHSQKTRESRLNFAEFLKLTQEVTELNKIIDEKAPKLSTRGDAMLALQRYKDVKAAFDAIFECKEKIVKILQELKQTIKYPKMATQLIDNTINDAFTPIDKKYMKYDGPNHCTY